MENGERLLIRHVTSSNNSDELSKDKKYSEKKKSFFFHFSEYLNDDF